MFIRRYYYDLLTGKTILSYMRQGDILKGSIEEDFLFYEELQGKDLSQVGVMEWEEPDAQIEENFASHNGVKVENGELVFYDETPVEPETPSYADLLTMYQAIERGMTT